jgi:Na+/H+ antiporter NhaC
LTVLSFAAVGGGGVFGDHCSPLSDTTVLSSLGGACDHIDHTRTQLPYAMTVAAVVCVVYLALGFSMAG